MKTARYPRIRNENDLLNVIRNLNHNDFDNVYRSLFSSVRNLGSIKGLKAMEKIMEKRKRYNLSDKMPLAASFFSTAGKLSYSSRLWEVYGIVLENRGFKHVKTVHIGLIVNGYAAYNHQRAESLLEMAWEELSSRDPIVWEESAILSSVSRICPHLIFHLTSSLSEITLRTLCKIHSALCKVRSTYVKSYISILAQEIERRGWSEHLDVGMISKIGMKNTDHTDNLIRTAIEEYAVRVTKNIKNNEKLEGEKKKLPEEVYDVELFHTLLSEILACDNKISVKDLERVVPPPQSPRELSMILYQFSRLSISSELQSSFDLCIEAMLSTRTDDLSSISTIMISLPHDHHLCTKLRSYFCNLSLSLGFRSVTNYALYSICRYLQYLQPHVENILREELSIRGMECMSARELSLYQRDLSFDIIPAVLKRDMFSQKLRELLYFLRVPEIQGHSELSSAIVKELATRDWSTITPLQFGSICSAVSRMRSSGPILNKIMFKFRSSDLPAPISAGVVESFKKLSLA